MRIRTALLTVSLASAVALAACGGDDDASTDDADQATATTAPTDDAVADADATGDPIAGVDLSTVGPPPDAAPQTAVVVVDGATSTFDGTELGVGQCEVTPDRIAIRIGQSGPWMAFTATPAGDAWSAGPSWQTSDDPPQYEGLPPGGEIVVDGSTVTFRGEVVIKNDVTDFDSWERTVGAVTVNCAAA